MDCFQRSRTSLLLLMTSVNIVSDKTAEQNLLEHPQKTVNISRSWDHMLEFYSTQPRITITDENLNLW